MATKESETLINVNSHRIRGNRKVAGNAEIKAPLVVRQGRGGRPQSCYRIEIVDEAGETVAEVIYDPENPLKCGAEVFISCRFSPRFQLFPTDAQDASSSAAQSTLCRRACDTGST